MRVSVIRSIQSGRLETQDEGNRGLFQAHGTATYRRLGRSDGQLALGQNLVDEAVFDGFFTAHEIVAIGITGNDVHGLASVMGKHLVQALANGQDFPGVNFDVEA